MKPDFTECVTAVKSWIKLGRYTAVNTDTDSDDSAWWVYLHHGVAELRVRGAPGDKQENYSHHQQPAEYEHQRYTAETDHTDRQTDI